MYLCLNVLKLSNLNSFSLGLRHASNIIARNSIIVLDYVQKTLESV